MGITDGRHGYGQALGSYDELVRWAATSAARKGAMLSVSTGPPLQARVNHNRWVVDCSCGGAAFATPGWPRAACLDCCTLHDVLFPPEALRLDAEAVLLRRVRLATRNWTPWLELPDDLQAENVREGA